MRAKALLVSMRPAQWAKNIFVLVAPMFGKRLTDGADLLLVGLNEYMAAIAEFLQRQ